MNIKKFKIRYILLVWVVVYLIISLFKYIKIKKLIYDKYGMVAKTFNTKMYINESIIVDGAMLIIGFPVLLLSGGWSFTQWAYSDVKFDFSQKTTTYIELKPKFMQNKFAVTMRGGEIVKDTFYETITIDPKFQHLYSEWVKKEVGIEDENVELYFNRASCGSRNIGDNVYIYFDKITDLYNLEKQLCENIHNIYIRSNHYEQGVDIKINSNKDITEILNYADSVEEKISDRIFIDTKHFMPSENNHLFIYILSQNNENHMITIMYDYDKNIKKYHYIDKDSDWIEYE